MKCRTWVGVLKTIYTTVYTLTPLSFDWHASRKNMTFLAWPQAVTPFYYILALLTQWCYCLALL